MIALGRAVRFVALLSLLSRAAWGNDLGPEARQHVEQATRLLQAEPPDYERAYQYYELAYEQGRDWRILLGLGRCAEALERDGEAIQAYEEFLARGAGTIAPDQQRAVERLLANLRAHLGRIIITSQIPELTLVVSRVGSTAPPQLHRLEKGRLEIEVRAGTHLVTAMSAGDRVEWQVALAPGIVAQQHFQFDRGPRLDSEDWQTPAQRTRGSPLRTLSLTAAGVGSAALVGGAVTGLLVLAKNSNARGLCRSLPDGGTECPESARADFDSTRSLATVTNWLLIGGGLLAAAGVGAFLVTEHNAQLESQALQVSPSVSLGSASLGVSGRF